MEKVKKSKRLTRVQLDKRNEKIRKLYSTGKYSHRSLAAKVGLAKSTIGDILW